MTRLTFSKFVKQPPLGIQQIIVEKRFSEKLLKLHIFERVNIFIKRQSPWHQP